MIQSNDIPILYLAKQ